MAELFFSNQVQNTSGIASQIARFFSSKSNPPYIGVRFSPTSLCPFERNGLGFSVKVGIPEFLTGVESHIPKLEEEIRELHKLLVSRTLRLKKLDFPVSMWRRRC